MLARKSVALDAVVQISDRRLRLALRAAGRALATDRPELVGTYAARTGITSSDSAARLAKWALFHRAAELFVGHSITKRGVLARVPAPADDALPCALAQAPIDGGGAQWSAHTFARLFHADERRPQGQFFTPPLLATFMANWAITSAGITVLDPGSGPGILLASAAARLRALGSLQPERQLHGVELCPLADTFAAVALRPQPAVPNVEQGDFLLWQAPHAFDAIVCNPPYTRHQGLASAYKEQIGAVIDELMGEHLSRRAGIYVHFLVRALAMLKAGGRLAFIAPRELLDASYGGAPKRYLLERCRLRALVIFDAGRTFAGVDTTSAITLVERGEPDGEPVRIVHVKRMPAAAELVRAVTARSAKGVPWGSIESIDREELARHPRWSRVRSGSTPDATPSDEVPLSELVDVKRGIATGANNYFLLSSTQVKAAGLPRKMTRPAIGRSRLARGTRVTQQDFDRWDKRGERIWLLDVRGEPSDEHVKAYIDAGEKRGVSKGYLCRSRQRWYEMEKREVPAILMTYMSKGAPRFLRNDAGLMPLNVFHGLYPRNLSKAEVSRLLQHLRSEAFAKRLRHGARTYADGLLKVEPRELAAVTVPDIRRKHQHTLIKTVNTSKNS